MRGAGFAIVIAACVVLPWRAHACSQPQIQNAFDTVAPTATDIVAVQVESLALQDSDVWPAGSGHNFRAQVRVLKHFRGSGRFTRISYHNDDCAGLRLNVGGIYLIATNARSPDIELESHDAPILYLAGFFTFDPDLVLRLSDTVKQLEAAIRGDGTFAITTDANRLDMRTDSPPPPVPPPADPDDE